MSKERLRNILKFVLKWIAFISFLISMLLVIGCTYRFARWVFGSPHTLDRLAKLLYHNMPIEFVNSPSGEKFVKPIQIDTNALVVEYILTYIISLVIFFLSGLYFYGLMESFRGKINVIFTKLKLRRKKEDL